MPNSTHALAHAHNNQWTDGRMSGRGRRRWILRLSLSERHKKTQPSNYASFPPPSLPQLSSSVLLLCHSFRVQFPALLSRARFEIFQLGCVNLSIFCCSIGLPDGQSECRSVIAPNLTHAFPTLVMCTEEYRVVSLVSALSLSVNLHRINTAHSTVRLKSEKKAKAASIEEPR